MSLGCQSDMKSTALKHLQRKQIRDGSGTPLITAPGRYWPMCSDGAKTPSSSSCNSSWSPLALQRFTRTAGEPTSGTINAAGAFPAVPGGTAGRLSQLPDMAAAQKALERSVQLQGRSG